MDKIREALEYAAEWHSDCYYTQEKAREALALLSAPVASDARELAVNDFRMDELDAVMHSVDKWFDEGDPRLKNNPATRAAGAREIALKAIEAIAERERKAREEEREACAERAVTWLEKPYALSGSNVAAHLRAAIKEAGNA